MELVHFFQIYSDGTVASEISGVIVLLCFLLHMEVEIQPPPAALPVALSTLYILVRLGKVTLICSLNYNLLSLNFCSALVPNHCLPCWMHCAVGDSSNPLPESERGFINICSIWIPPVLLVVLLLDSVTIFSVRDQLFQRNNKCTQHRQFLSPFHLEGSFPIAVPSGWLYWKGGLSQRLTSFSGKLKSKWRLTIFLFHSFCKSLCTINAFTFQRLVWIPRLV